MGNRLVHFGLLQGELSISPQPGFLKRPHRLWALWATRPRSSSTRRSGAGLELESNAVDVTEQHRSEVYLGVPVIIFAQADDFTGQRLGDKNQLALPFNLAVAAHPSQFEVAGVGWVLEARRIRPQRGRVNHCRHGLAQCFVRTLMVVQASVATPM